MADTPTNRYGARQQSLGSNTNTWGDTKLNEVIALLDRGSKGYQALTINGDATVTWTNYIATNDAQVETLKLTSGTVAAAFTLTFPSKEWAFNVWNNTSYAATIKCSAGTGITIPAGRKVRLFCDATDIGDSTPNYLPTATTLTNPQDIPSYTQTQTLIANAALPASTGAILNSAADTTAGYLSTKQTVATADDLFIATKATANPAANENTQWTFSARRVLRRATFIGQV